MLKGKVVDKERDVLSREEKSVVLLAGSQAPHVRPSDKGNVKVETS
jgi:hypothetical protein